MAVGVQVGLGIGDKFSMLDHEALGRPFPSFSERARFLEACCVYLPRLWRGETVTNSALGLNRAALGSTDIPSPPLLIGGGSRALLELAARNAQGWNLFTHEPETFAARAAVLSHMEMAISRRDRLTKSVYLFVDKVERNLRQVVHSFAAHGADEAMLVVRNPTAGAIFELARQVR